MPEMSGGAAFAELKKIRPEVKMLISSGFSKEGSASEILRARACGFIQKPFRIRDLSASLSSILKK